MVKALRYLRKSDLVIMAEDLDIDEPASYLRDDLETLVKETLIKQRPVLENKPEWAEHYHVMDQGDRRAARSSTAQSADSDETDDSPVRSTRSPRKVAGNKLANGVATPLRRASNIVASESTSAFSSLRARTQRSFENLTDIFRSGAAEVRAEASDAAHAVQEAPGVVAHRAKVSQRALHRKATATWKRAQQWSSSAEHITTALVAVELVLIVLSIMPTKYLEFGQHSVANLVKSHGKTTAGRVPHWAITVPNFWALLAPAFWKPLILWAAYTVALPAVFAHLITFDRRREPSVLTFALVRLFGILYLTRFASQLVPHVPNVLGVAAGETAAKLGALTGLRFYTSYAWVSAAILPEVQILGSAAAASFALYETIAVRPRSA